MSERAQLPTDYNTVFEQLMEADDFEDPAAAELVQDARDTAWQMATALSGRLEDLDLDQFNQTFHDFPMSDGSIRVAITPPYGNLDTSTGPVWRIVINEGQIIYKDGKPKEQWDVMDILVEPGDLRLSVNTARLNYVVGYGETGSPPGVPPRVIRDVDTYQYSQNNARGYGIALPEVPPATPGERLKSYQTFSNTVGTVLEVFSKLSDITKREATTNLEQNEEF
jgi:hypothetical protein